MKKKGNKKPGELYPKFDKLKSPKSFISEIERLKNTEKKYDFFSIKTANEWIEIAKKTPTPKMLFSEFWHEGEICILFADSNLGKSILAVQIADSISKGQNIKGFKLDSKKQKVLYFDFELSAKQFEIRYAIKDEYESEVYNHYRFDDNFKRIEINPDAEIPDGLKDEDYLNLSIEKSIIETNAKILIIDNITYLKNNNESAKDALPLMKHLKALKSKYDLSILALAHTPKRDLSSPISQNYLQGSKMLFNFIDSCFAIGISSVDSSIRYIKQIKARNTSMIYDCENVITCEIHKPHNFLKFSFLEFSSERDHLRHSSDDAYDARMTEVVSLKESGKTNVEIAKIYDVSEGAVRKWLKKVRYND